MKVYVDKNGLQEFATKLNNKQKTIFAAKSLESTVDSLMTAVGSPLVASTAAEMTDTNKIYVYVGSETGYTSGNWYYYDGSTWTSGGVYNSTAFETDETLTILGAAADAKITGLGFKELEIDISNNVSWRTKQINPSSGAIYTNDSAIYISTTDYIPATAAIIKCAAGYAFEIFVYDNSGAYQGVWNGSALQTSNKWLADEYWLGNIGTNYKYKIQLKKSDGSNISLSDATNILFYSFVDESVSLAKKAPEAAAVGTKIAEVKSIADFVGGNLIAKGYTPLDAQWYINATSAKIQKSASVGICMISVPIIGGQSYTVWKRTSTIMRIGTGGEIPEGATEMTLTRAVRHSSASSNPLTIRAGAADTVLYIQLFANADSDSLKSIAANIGSLVVSMSGDGAQTQTQFKLRVMTYNIGGFNYGTHTLPPAADISDIISAYRQFFCKYKPDLVAINEYEAYLDNNEEYSTDEQIFDTLFPDKYPVGSYSVADYIKSKFVLDSKSSTVISYEEGSNEAHITCRLAHITIGTVNMAFISTHLLNNHTDFGIRCRNYWLEKIVEMLEPYDYAIFGGDMNFGGNDLDENRTEDISSADEVAQKIALMESLGYGVANGGYLSPQKTINKNTNCIDHIFYKNNGNIVFNDCQVLGDEYANLYSDHYPVIADFLIR